MSKVALVTGALGQDGSYLCEFLVQKGYQVVGTTHRECRRLDLDGATIPIVCMPLSDPLTIQKVLLESKPDEIYHLASRASSAQLFDDATATADINALGTMRILEVLRQHLPQTRLCQAGSSEIFVGSSESPQNEKTAMHPVNAYGASKAYSRHLIAAYRQQFQINAFTAILFNHESPRRDFHFVTRKITAAAAAIHLGLQERLILHDLNSIRDWGHAKDMVRGMWLMMQKQELADVVLSTGISRTVAQFCEAAFGYVGLDYRRFVDTQSNFSGRKEQVILCGDNAFALSYLGWKPEISFSELIAEMVESDLVRLRS
jgi:GDPmannose 4,6-dehydratase